MNVNEKALCSLRLSVSGATVKHQPMEYRFLLNIINSPTQYKSGRITSYMCRHPSDICDHL